MKQTGDAVSLVYQCRLPLSTSTVNYVADLLRKHLKAIRSRWRTLPTGRIVVLVLAVLRHDQRAADLAGGNDVSDTTIRRWTNEIIDLLAARAPRLDRALKKTARRGGEVVLIGGTLLPTPPPTPKANPPHTTRKPPPPRPATTPPRACTPGPPPRGGAAPPGPPPRPPAPPPPPPPPATTTSSTT